MLYSYVNHIWCYATLVELIQISGTIYCSIYRYIVSYMDIQPHRWCISDYHVIVLSYESCSLNWLDPFMWDIFLHLSCSRNITHRMQTTCNIYPGTADSITYPCISWVKDNRTDWLWRARRFHLAGETPFSIICIIIYLTTWRVL